jgi:hypothetical protein
MATARLCNALAVPLFMLMLLISSTLRWVCSSEVRRDTRARFG